MMMTQDKVSNDPFFKSYGMLVWVIVIALLTGIVSGTIALTIISFNATQGKAQSDLLVKENLDPRVTVLESEYTKIQNGEDILHDLALTTKTQMDAAAIASKTQLDALDKKIDWLINSYSVGAPFKRKPE